MSKGKKHKSSSGAGHPYLKGYRFWSEHQFWNTDYHSPKAKEYFNNSLNAMLSNARSLSTLDNTIL